MRSLFDYLQRIEFDRDRLARLEWSYLPAFEFEPAPPTLSNYLSVEPAFFVDVVCQVFPPDDEGQGDEAGGKSVEGMGFEGEPNEQMVAVARNGYRLLSEWRTLPGHHGDTVDGEALHRWVVEARTRLKEQRRLGIGDDFIGKLLTSGPPDADGVWPCRGVRDLLEAVESPEMDDAFATEVVNSPGVTTRGALDGGDQERGRSALYREQAQRLVDGWPKTAGLLRDAAESFERMARDHDADAERRRTGF